MVGEEGRVVQELAESAVAPPPRYVQKDGERPGDLITAPLPSVSVPVVDIRRLIGHADADEATKLRSALEEWGLFQVIGHEMSESLLDELQNVARAFFHLPMEEKQKYSNMKNNLFELEGYGTDRIVTDEQTLDWTDRLYLLVLPEDKRKLELWPDYPSSFRNVLHEFTTKTWLVAEHVLRAIANLLELREDYFTNQFGDRPDIYARFNYYPHCSRPDLVFGIKPHSDGSAITILLPDKDVEGLQVMKDNEWFNVSTVPHALLINMGDQMEIMSNGVFKSPVHRVVTNSEKERISVAMFCALAPEKEIEPAETLVDETRPRLYKKVNIREYLEVLFENFSKGKRAIDFAKV